MNRQGTTVEAATRGTGRGSRCARADRAGVRPGRAPREPRTAARGTTRAGAADPAVAVLRRADPDRDRRAGRALPDACVTPAVANPGPAAPPTGHGLTDGKAGRGPVVPATLGQRGR